MTTRAKNTSSAGHGGRQTDPASRRSNVLKALLAALGVGTEVPEL